MQNRLVEEENNKDEEMMSETTSRKKLCDNHPHIYFHGWVDSRRKRRVGEAFCNEIMPVESLWTSWAELWFLLKTKPYDTQSQMYVKGERDETKWKRSLWLNPLLILQISLFSFLLLNSFPLRYSFWYLSYKRTNVWKWEFMSFSVEGEFLA